MGLHHLSHVYRWLIIAIRKKAKIMRKVKYPLQFDASDLVRIVTDRNVCSYQVTDDLRARIRPLNTFTKAMSQNRDDRAKQLKTARNKVEQEVADKDLRNQEKEQFDRIAQEVALEDNGANASGMYELCGMWACCYGESDLTL